MGKKPMRECAKSGCHNLTRESYCDKHKTLFGGSMRHKIYDATVRDKKAAEFYHSAKWKKVRAQAISRAHGLCQDCLARGIITKADMVHHVKPLREYPEHALDLDNLKPLCNACHAKY